MEEKKKLFEEFPPVTTEQWEAVIEKDLKGACMKWGEYD